MDPSTFAHAPQCEHRDVTEPSIVKALLTVLEREDYWYVQCGSCETGWQVPHYAAQSVG
jgi:hypothetical protein